MVNVDFMLGQRRRVNTIGLHRPNVFLMLGLCRKQWTNNKSILDQCIALTETHVCTPVRTMTQRWVHVNPQSEIMSQHQTKSGCYNHFVNTAGILVLHKAGLQ